MKAFFKTSKTEATIEFKLQDLGHTVHSWAKLSKDQQNNAIEEYWNSHRDSVVYWKLEDSTQKLTTDNLEKIDNFEDLIKLIYGDKRSVLRSHLDAISLPSQIGVRLKKLRLQLGVTQVQLSRDTGYKKSFICRIENSNVDIRISTFFKILSALLLENK